MTKSVLKKTAKELFKVHMGIDISISNIALCECSTENVNVSYDEQFERVTYLWFRVGNRHYVYTDRLYKSFAMFPDDTLTDGIELMK